jgi:hypothetical protein
MSSTCTIDADLCRSPADSDKNRDISPAARRCIHGATLLLCKHGKQIHDLLLAPQEWVKLAHNMYKSSRILIHTQHNSMARGEALSAKVPACRTLRASSTFASA